LGENYTTFLQFNKQHIHGYLSPPPAPPSTGTMDRVARLEWIDRKMDRLDRTIADVALGRMAATSSAAADLASERIGETSSAAAEKKTTKKRPRKQTRFEKSFTYPDTGLMFLSDDDDENTRLN
jgi:hypothetical protein